MNAEILKKLDALRITFDALDVKLPLKAVDGDIGSVADADGEDVVTIDVNNERDDSQVKAITALIVDLINASAGFIPNVAYQQNSDSGNRRVA